MSTFRNYIHVSKTNHAATFNYVFGNYIQDIPDIELSSKCLYEILFKGQTRNYNMIRVFQDTFNEYHHWKRRFALDKPIR